MINQLLAGIHIAAAGEAMGLAAKAGLNTRQVYDIILTAAGSSWMFENRVPHMLVNDLTPYSALDIFVKDMVSYNSLIHSDFPCLNRGYIGYRHLLRTITQFPSPALLSSRTALPFRFIAGLRARG